MTRTARGAETGLADAAPAVEMRNVSFRYANGPEALSGVSVSIRMGDFACVIGPNGGGKTTLLKLMLGLLRPASGEVRVLGMSPTEAQRHIGYMPQQSHFDPQFPARVIDVVLMGRLGAGVGFGPFRAADRRAALDALNEVGMADLAARPLSGLSGGQRRRVLIARALACDPKALMLDEPTANLDIPSEEQMYALLARLNERLTVIMVSHDLGFVSKYVRTAVCVNRNVHVHAMGDLSREEIFRLYGREIRLVEHSAGPGHRHGPDCHHLPVGEDAAHSHKAPGS
ncbi:MAG: ABC transporter ATP-binding protein [Phycisphaerales bacterium]|nr:ABC transporter ATP-binding protein [Phycisphaerales bacterium]